MCSQVWSRWRWQLQWHVDDDLDDEYIGGADVNNNNDDDDNDDDEHLVRSARLSGLSPNTSRDTNWLPLSSTIFTPNLFTSLLFPTFWEAFCVRQMLLLFVDSFKAIWNLKLELKTLLNDQRRFAHAIDGLFKLRWAQHWCGYVCFNSRVKLNRSLPLISIGSNFQIEWNNVLIITTVIIILTMIWEHGRHQ